MKKFHALTFFFFLIIGMTNVSAQKEIAEGKITMELNKIESSDPSTAGMLKMMEGSTLIVNFNAKKSLTEMDMMGGMMKTTTLMEKDSNKTIIIMDMMGTKQMAESKEEKKEDAAKPNIEVTYDKSDTKKILDYNCHRADIKVKNDNGQTMNMTAYVTTDLKLGADLIQNVNSESIEGVPLEYSIAVSQQGMSFSMTFTVTELLDYVDASVFDLKYDDIPKVDMDQLMKGGGLGF